MKAMLGLISCFGLIGCATAIPLTDKESCAIRDLKLVGVDTGYGTSVGFATVTSTNSSHSARVSSTGHSYGEFRQCRLPATDEDKSEIENLKAEATPKLRYNQNIRQKKIWTGIGYVAYIIPGIVLKVSYDNQYDEAVNESAKIREENLGRQKLQQRTPANKLDIDIGDQ
ncbi:MAG: hypothetical protein AB7G93_15270 [Bdellovibrionales bacterium]